MASLVESILISINASVSGAAGIAQLTGGIGGLTSKLVGLNQGMQVIGQVTAGVNQLVSQMGEYARKADGAAVAARSWQIVLERFNVDAGKAEASMQMLADKTGATTESLKGAAAQYIKMGGTLEDFEKGALAAASSWYDLSVKSISLEDSISNVTLGLAQGRSELMETSGIVVNASQAWKKYADANNTTVDAMDDATKAHAYALAVYKEEQIGIETLADKQTALSKAETQATNSKKELGKAIGTLVLPAYTQMITGSTQVTRGITEMLQAYAKGEDGLAKLTQAFPGLSSVMGKIGPESGRMKEAITSAWDAIRGTYDSVLKPIFERLEPLVKRVMAEVPRVVSAAANAIRENFLLIQAIWNTVLKPVWDAIAPVVQAALGQVINLLGGLLNFIAGVNAAIRKLLEGDFKGAWAAARDAVGNALLKIQDALAELAPKLWKVITDIATNVYGKAKMIGLNLKDGILAGFADLGAGLANKMADAVEGMLAKIPPELREFLGLDRGLANLRGIGQNAGNAAADARDRIDARGRPIQGPQLGGDPGTGTDVSGKALLTMMGLGGRNTGTPFGGKYFGGQIHNGEDIFAKTGTQMVAGFTGYISTRWSETTGHIIEMIDAEGKKLVLGHLDRYAEGVQEAIKAANAQGKQLLVKQGDLIGYVGQTGSLAHKDLGPGNAHVHAMGYTASGKLVNPLSQTYKSVQGEGNAVYIPPTPRANAAAKNMGNPSPDAPVAPNAEAVGKAAQAEIQAILARLDLKLIGKDAAVKLLAQIDADATRIARKQGTGWQEYAATAKSAASAIEGLKKGNSAAKEAKDILGALSTQYEYVGKTGLPAYVAGLNAFIAAQDRAAKSAKAGSKEQIAAQANVNRARQLLKDSAGPKGEVVVSDADLKKYSAAAREVAKLEAAIPKSTDTAWVARAQARIAAYNAQGEAAQKVLGIIQGTSSRQQEIDNQAAEDLKQAKADQETAAKTLTSLTQEQLQQRVAGQEAAEKKIVGLRDAALKAAGTDAQARLGIEQNAAAALKRQAQNTAEAQLILAKRTAEEAYRTTISGIPEKASAAQVKAITEAAQKVRSGSISGAYTSYYGAIGKAAEEGRDRVTAAQDALTATLQAGVDAGNAALASLDTTKLSGQELAGAAQLLIPAEKTFEALYIRIVAMQSELAKPGVADAWGESIAELGRRGRLTADQIGILKTAISGLAAIDANLQEFGGVSTDVNTGGTVYQTEDQLRGIGVAAENARDDFFDLGNAAQNAISLTRAELDGLLATSKLLPEQIEAIARAWADFNGPDLATPGAMLGGLIDDLQTAQDAFDSGGTGLEDTLARFDVLRGVAASIDSDAARGLVSYIDQFTTAWRELRQETSNSEATGAVLGGLIDDLQTAQDAFDSGGATLEDTLSRFESLRAVADGIDSDAARGLVNYIDQFTASWKELSQTLSASEANGAMLGGLIDEMQAVQDAFDLGGAGLDDTLAKFEALRAKAASIDDDGARGLVAYIDQFTASWKQLRQETTSMEADGSAIGSLIDQLQAAEDAFYKGGASISDTRGRLADLREQLTLIGGPVATALIGAVDEMTAGFDRAAEAADTFYAALNPEGPIPEAVSSTLARLDEVAQGFESGTVSVADFGAATLSTAKELDKMAKAADLAGKPDLANSIRQTAAALRAVTPEVAKYMDKLGKFAEYAGYVQELAGAFSGLASAVGNDDLAANLDGIANLAGKAMALASDVVRILANPADVGAWVGAISKIVSGIADAIGGFQKARAEAKKLAEDFNKQFSLIDASTFSSFTTRSRGWLADLFGGGPEVVKQVNEAAATIAKTIETGVLGGFQNGIKAFLNGTGTMLDAIREGVRGAIIDAITQAVIQGAIIKGALGSLLTELTNGLAAGTDVSGVIAQIGAALPGIAKGLETTLKPLKDAVDKALPASTPVGSASSSGSSFGSGSSTFQAGTPAVVIDVLTQTRDLLKGANDASRLMVDAARSLGGHVDRFGDYVDKLNGPHNSATAGAR